ncbi:cold-shock protein [Streptomyces sp. SP17BM10]|uniref:cold-shock protein n=1 Tax=Streptomyces sp. SP17BM10 TaxID=3002530 RepID=UPI002E77DCE3|nr:cold-shock protein [Streptomyces sp. SP17BM10]MEE1789094.1 cold-shock protein [Streptomyces sp. SP17BM10]
MPTGQVKWFNETKGFGFLSRDDGGDVFVHTKALPTGVTSLKPGQRVEFGVVAGHRGDQAMAVQLLEALPSVAAAQRRSADDMAPIVQDLITTLDAVLPGLQHGRYPAKPTGQKLAALLRAVADQFDL